MSHRRTAECPSSGVQRFSAWHSTTARPIPADDRRATKKHVRTTYGQRSRRRRSEAVVPHDDETYPSRRQTSNEETRPYHMQTAYSLLSGVQRFSAGLFSQRGGADLQEKRTAANEESWSEALPFFPKRRSRFVGKTDSGAEGGGAERWHLRRDLSQPTTSKPHTPRRPLPKRTLRILHILPFKTYTFLSL